MIKRFEPKYLNVLFVTSLIASILCNICFLALKVVRVKELQQNDFTIVKVMTREIIKLIIIRNISRLPTEAAVLSYISPSSLS